MLATADVIVLTKDVWPLFLFFGMGRAAQSLRVLLPTFLALAGPEPAPAPQGLTGKPTKTVPNQPH